MALFPFGIGFGSSSRRHCTPVVLSTGKGICACDGGRPPDGRHRKTELGEFFAGWQSGHIHADQRPQAGKWPLHGAGRRGHTSAVDGRRKGLLFGLRSGGPSGGFLPQVPSAIQTLSVLALRRRTTEPCCS